MVAGPPPTRMASSSSSATECRAGRTPSAPREISQWDRSVGNHGVLGIDEDVLLLTENDDLERVAGDGQVGDGEFAVTVLDGRRRPRLIA